MTQRLIACANRTWQALLLFATIVTALGLLVALIEGWALGSGVWWAFTTATTTGYGDLAPVGIPSRALGVLTMFVGIIGIGVIVGRIAASVIETRDAWKHEEQEQVKANLAAIRVDVAALLARTPTVQNITVTGDWDRDRDGIIGTLRKVGDSVRGRTSTTPPPSARPSASPARRTVGRGGYGPAPVQQDSSFMPGLLVGSLLSDGHHHDHDENRDQAAPAEEDRTGGGSWSEPASAPEPANDSGSSWSSSGSSDSDSSGSSWSSSSDSGSSYSSDSGGGGGWSGE